MSLVDQQCIFLDHLCLTIQHARSLGFQVTGGELARTPEQQQIYVKTGRSKTMASYHLRRLAADLNFFKDGKLIYDKAELKPIGDYFESLDTKNSWGGNWDSFKDVPHFERRA